MYRILYAIPFQVLLLGMLLFCVAWDWARKRLENHKAWKWSHFAVLLLWFAAVLYMTLGERDPGGGAVNLTPLWSYRIAFLEGSFDYFQQIYLNILAFFFFGLFAPELLRGKWRFAAVVLMGIAISAGIEFLQFRLDLGLAEFDDVLSNTLGTLLGVLTNRYITGLIRVVTQWITNLLRYLHRHTTE